MSKEYRQRYGKDIKSKTSQEMRLHCQRPGTRSGDGKILYFTEQSHKKQCDVNEIIKKYDKTGLITHVQRFEAKFGDFTGMDFQNMQNQVIKAQNMFDALPVEIRKRFKNNPQELLTFMEDETNRAEAIELGLIAESTHPDLDGLGEHVILDENGEPKRADGKPVPGPKEEPTPAPQA